MKTAGLVISSPLSNCISSTPRLNASLMIGPSSKSVVMCVIRARFFTKPQAWQIKFIFFKFLINPNKKKLAQKIVTHYSMTILLFHRFSSMYFFWSHKLINLSCSILSLFLFIDFCVWLIASVQVSFCVVISEKLWCQVYRHR